MSFLTEEQKQRYKRNILLQEIGVSGQEKLLSSSVLIIGLGGTGSHAALYLAAAGVGTLGLVDFDDVDISNLQRQIIHSVDDIGLQKTQSAKNTITSLNPDVTVLTFNYFEKSTDLLSVIRDFDFVIEATDNFPSKFLINDLCVKAKTAFSHSGVSEFSGQTMTVLPGEGACFRCVFGEIPDENAVPPATSLGILGAVAGVLGTIQSTEAIKYLTGIGGNLKNTLMTFDAKKMEFRKIVLKQQLTCPACSCLTK
jgi:molybdopterin-synthase adenylyltransferase